MINIDVFTIGSEFKSDNGETYIVISNFGDKNKLYVELEKKVEEDKEELIKEL